MTDKLVECLKNLEIHADVLMKIPADAQHLVNLQAVVSIALLEAKRAIEEVARCQQTVGEGRPSTP